MKKFSTKIRRIMIAAPKSGSGKTIVTCVLMQALKNSGYAVTSYKCGPDYIDPMFHEKILGVPAGNLDTFFTGEEETKALFLKRLENGAENRIDDNSFAVLEGVMGLYDGLGGVREEGSSYHLAKVTKTPIVLVIDAKGMGRSVISMTAGFLAYDKEHLIQGVILNRMSEAFYKSIKPLMEQELKIPVLGFLPEREALHIESRHLGLVRPDELQDIKERIAAASQEFVKTVSMKSIVEIAKRAEELEQPVRVAKLTGSARIDTLENSMTVSSTAAGGSLCRPIIAVAKDEAFCFYYAENIRLLEENGADICYFSPLHDKKLPDGAHALLFGGGYPELYADALSENHTMRAAVKKASESGMPIVAECGGFMYLHSSITDREGNCHEMAGVIEAACFDSGKLVRFGYIELREKQSYFLPEGETIKGHEFHYYDSGDNGDGAVAVKPVTGKEYSCMIEDETHWMGFPHLYYPSNPAFAKAFVEKARNYQEKLYLAGKQK
ncbi:MAG: cobyrinate a,c-diamide synthase [Bacillus sp. (in: Bacteria)]|nr:cobyrinate a,c-diamide synthase [Bacillus sp. (in: firmicutes)]MCM1427447.1 cobyrinate a,c-diamide synthase [Eubacterium sp.]